MRLTAVRKSGQLKYLRPDGKSQVTVEYDENNRPVRVDTVVVSTQHDPDVSLDTIRKDMIEQVIKAVIPADMLDGDTKYYVRPRNSFRQGRPRRRTPRPDRTEDHRECMPTAASHGGGKRIRQDHQVDRSPATAARYVAKNIVAAGLAKRCQVELAYAIGVAQPVSILVDTFGTGTVSDDKLETAVRKVFDLRPTAIIRDLDLRKPI